MYLNNLIYKTISGEHKNISILVIYIKFYLLYYFITYYKL